MTLKKYPIHHAPFAFPSLLAFNARVVQYSTVQYNKDLQLKESPEPAKPTEQHVWNTYLHIIYMSSHRDLS